jgi:nucleoid DNA-binding protein
VREARAVIDAVFGSIKNALGRHEFVKLPIGPFNVLQNPEKYARRTRWQAAVGEHPPPVPPFFRCDF